MDNYIGKTLDNRYEILEVIGMGGMAVVYKARCHRLNRQVALKILKPEYARNDEFRKRFHTESRAVAMLSHPNIVAVYDVSRSTLENEYIVMELIDGITLKQYIQKKGSLNWRESLHFSTQIAKALSHAHGRGIIHRDIKPHNIMILRDGSVKVADFGIARFASKQNTLTQEALGSVHYISPEQARGSHIDARSDIYSVGVVMYEMLTNRLPYEGDSPVSVAIQHINSIPLTPREIDPTIPEALEAITMKSMSPSLIRRYESAEALLHDLEEFRKNPKISFDYDIAELTAREDIDEPTRKFSNGAQKSGPSRPGADGRNRRGSRDPRDAREDDAYNARQRNKSLAMISGVLSILIFIAGMLYLVFNLPSWTPPDVPNGPENSSSIQVPRLVGKHWDNEVNKMPLYGEWIINQRNEGEYNDFWEEGVIIAQTPDEGTYVKKDNNVITVTLSLGKERISLPDMRNKEYREAQNQLRANGFVCGDSNIKYEYNDDYTKDFVFRTEPSEYTGVPRGTAITLYVSRGPEVEKVIMPHLTDKTVTEAERLLEQADLLYLPHKYIESDKPAGTVLSQDIPTSTTVDVRTEVQLEVSLGPQDDPTDDPDPATPDPATPTPDPATPTPDPVTPPPDKISVPVTVTLPAEPETLTLKYQLNGVILDIVSVSTSQREVTRNITGNPEDILEIFFDEILMYTGPLSGYAR